MKLVLGGAYQGKKEAASRLFGCRMEEIKDGARCTLPEIETCTAICNFHLYARRWKEAHPEGEAQELADAVIRANPKLIVITDEIGYGIVPMDAAERSWREFTGRVLCLLAAYAGTVVRVVAGIPAVIRDTGRECEKGEER